MSADKKTLSCIDIDTVAFTDSHQFKGTEAFDFYKFILKQTIFDYFKEATYKVVCFAFSQAFAQVQEIGQILQEYFFLHQLTGGIISIFP